MATKTRKLLTLAEAAEALGGVHIRTVRRYISEGRLKGYKMGPRLVMIDEDDLQALLTPIPTWTRK